MNCSDYKHVQLNARCVQTIPAKASTFLHKCGWFHEHKQCSPLELWTSAAQHWVCTSRVSQRSSAVWILQDTAWPVCTHPAPITSSITSI